MGRRVNTRTLNAAPVTDAGTAPDPGPPGRARAAALITDRITGGQLTPGTRVRPADISAALPGVPLKEIRRALNNLGDNGTLTRTWENGTRAYHVPGKPAAAAAEAGPDPLTRLAGSPYITVQDIADTLKVSRMTVYRLLRDGEIASFRVGRSFRITSRALTDYLRSRTTRPDGTGNPDGEQAGPAA